MAARRTHRFYGTHKALEWISFLFPFDPAWTRWLAAAMSAVAGFVLALVPFSSPDYRRPEWLAPIVPVLSWVNDHQLDIAVFAFVAIPSSYILFVLHRWLLPKRYSRRQLKLAVDAIASAAFGKCRKDEENHSYRVTLFKVRRLRPFGKWLGLVASSGQMYQKHICVFSIDSEAEEKNTGIVGECWRRDGNSLMVALPIDTGDTDRFEADCYKETGFVDDCEFRDLKRKPVVIMAIGIRKNGQLWGILAYDTTDVAVRNRFDVIKREQLGFAAEMFGMLL